MAITLLALGKASGRAASRVLEKERHSASLLRQRRYQTWEAMRSLVSPFRSCFRTPDSDVLAFLNLTNFPQRLPPRLIRNHLSLDMG